MVPQAKQQSQLDDFAMSCAAACCPWQHATYLLRPGHPVKTESHEIIIRLLHWLMFEHLFLFNMTMKPVSFSEWTLLIPSQVRKFEKKEGTLLIYHVSSYIPIYLQGIRYMIYDIEYIYIYIVYYIPMSFCSIFGLVLQSRGSMRNPSSQGLPWRAFWAP